MNESAGKIMESYEPIPIEDQNPAAGLRIVQLTDFGRNADIIEDAKSHGPITFRMVSRRPDDCNGVFDRPASDGSACFYGASSG